MGAPIALWTEKEIISFGHGLPILSHKPTAETRQACRRNAKQASTFLIGFAAMSRLELREAVITSLEFGQGVSIYDIQFTI